MDEFERDRSGITGWFSVRGAALLSPGDLIRSGGWMYNEDDSNPMWKKLREGTLLIFLECHRPSGKIRAISPDGAIVWLVDQLAQCVARR